jgi:hypothetical protein
MYLLGVRVSLRPPWERGASRRAWGWEGENTCLFEQPQNDRSQAGKTKIQAPCLALRNKPPVPFPKPLNAPSEEPPRWLAKPPGCMARRSTCGKTEKWWRRNRESLSWSKNKTVAHNIGHRYGVTITPPPTFPIRPLPAPALFSSLAPACPADSRICEECASLGHGAARARFPSPSNQW